MPYDGWIKLWRKSVFNRTWSYKPFSPFHAWIDLLLRTNHRKGWSYAPNKAPVEVDRGQLLTSMYQLASDWGWSRGRVERWLRSWKNEHQIELVTTPYYTLITILKWEEYQGAGDTSDNTSDRASGSASGELVIDTNKNNKNDKNDKNIKDIATTPQKRGSGCPLEKPSKGENEKLSLMRKKYPNGHGECVEFIKSCKSFPNFAKQIGALHQILRAGFDFEVMNKAISEMEKDEFYRDKAGWDFSTLSNYIGRRWG